MNDLALSGNECDHARELLLVCVSLHRRHDSSELLTGHSPSSGDQAHDCLSGVNREHSGTGSHTAEDRTLSLTGHGPGETGGRNRVTDSGAYPAPLPLVVGR